MLSLLALVRFFVCVVREVLLRSCGIGVRGGSHGIGHGGGDFGRLIGGDAFGFCLLVSLGTLLGALLALVGNGLLRGRDRGVTTPLTTSAVETGTSVPRPLAPWEAERSAFAWPRATDSSLARRDLNALRTREVTLFTNSTGALVTVSTASTAEATESVISFTSSRI